MTDPLVWFVAIACCSAVFLLEKSPPLTAAINNFSPHEPAALTYIYPVVSPMGNRCLVFELLPSKILENYNLLGDNIS
jgi:hypothetical protein